MKYLKHFANAQEAATILATWPFNTISSIEGQSGVQYSEGVPPAPAHDYVEIGGIKWATMNVGAETMYDDGLYFQWGDTQGYTAEQVGNGEGQKYFGWNDYKWGTQGHETKYNSTDKKTTLDLEDDAVHAAWGGNWRMPTLSELQTLNNSVNAVYTTNYNNSGVAGLVCTDKTDSNKVLFFPGKGHPQDGAIYKPNKNGKIWCNTCTNNYGSYDNAEQIVFGYNYPEDRTYFYIGTGGGDKRCWGSNARGVLDE